MAQIVDKQMITVPRLKEATIVISGDEAQFLRDVLYQIGGSPEKSRRRYADSLLKMFHEDLGIKTDGQAEDIDPKYRAIYFKNEEN